MKVIDCAVSAAAVIPALKKAGINVVVRYFGLASSWKTADKAECNALRKAGIDLVTVYETTATMMVGSNAHADGVAGAKTAKAGIIAAGGPANAFVYFACDTNTQNHTAVEAYLKGAAEVLGASRVGIYGSYDVCAHALANHSAAKAWQTLAWSSGKRLATAALYQQNGAKPYNLGIDYDWNIVQSVDVGQWGYVVAAPKPVPVPTATPYNRIVWGFPTAYARLNPSIASRVLKTLANGDKVTAVPGGTILWAKTTVGYILRTRLRTI